MELLEKEQLSAKELKILMQEHSRVYILDVRSPLEYERYHIEGALNIHILDLSLDEVKRRLNLTNQNDIILVTYCNAGGRGGRSFLMLREQNISPSNIKIKNLKDGINDWLNQGYPVKESI